MLALLCDRPAECCIVEPGNDQTWNAERCHTCHALQLAIMENSLHDSDFKQALWYRHHRLCPLVNLLARPDACQQSVHVNVYRGEMPALYCREGDGNDKGTSRLISQLEQGSHQSINPTRLNVCKKDGNPWLLGSGGFGSVTAQSCLQSV